MADHLALSPKANKEPAHEHGPMPERNSVSFAIGASLRVGACVQEWTGNSWVIVEEHLRVEGSLAQVLDASRVQGKYVGERVVTPCLPV
jgi:hypothetical protein